MTAKRNPTRSVRVGTAFIGSAHRGRRAEHVRHPHAGRRRHRRAGGSHPQGRRRPRPRRRGQRRRTSRPWPRSARQTRANLVVDLQENYRLAASVAPHVDKVRYNPGHLYHHEREKPVRGEGPLPRRRGARARLRDPRRRQLRQRRPRDQGAAIPRTTSRPWSSPRSSTARCSTTSGFDRYVVSLKDSHPRKVIEANTRFAALRPDVPLHLGVTEAGIPPDGDHQDPRRLRAAPLARHRRHHPRQPHPAQPAQARGDHGRAGRSSPTSPPAASAPCPVFDDDKLNIISCPSCSRVENEKFVELAEEVKEMTRLRGAPRPHHRGDGLPRERPRRDRRRRPGPLVRPHPRQPEAQDGDGRAPSPTTRSCPACAASWTP